MWFRKIDLIPGKKPLTTLSGFLFLSYQIHRGEEPYRFPPELIAYFVVNHLIFHLSPDYVPVITKYFFVPGSHADWSIITCPAEKP
jgi:hypothetical protein